MLGGYRVGDRTVTIPRNPAGTPFTLLRAESDFARAVGVEGRVAFAFRQNLAVEVGGAYSTPELGVTISQDPELTTAAVASERVQQYTVDVSGVFQLPVRIGTRARPYAIGGAGYLRQLHEGRLLVETGRSIHVGGGLQYWLRGANGSGRAVGVRGEARVVRRTGGVDFDERSRTFPALSILAFFGF